VKLSIIIAILESYDVTVRQIKHFRSILSKEEFCNDCELIFLDDGSKPPLIDTIQKNFGEGFLNEFPLNTFNFDLGFSFKLLVTNDFRPWTSALARNAGAKVARGNMLFMTDIDHILTEEAIRTAKDFNGDMMQFIQNFGSLNSDGNIVVCNSEFTSLQMARNLVHRNTFVMRKVVFLSFLRGYDEEIAGKYADSSHINKKYKILFLANKVKPLTIGPSALIYVYENPEKKSEIFHSLKRPIRKI
jgi:hypothetical protein